MATPTASMTTPQQNQRSVPPTGASGLMAYDSPAVLHMLSEGISMSMSGLGMSQLGLTASAMGRADEAERTRRLHTIIDTLKQKPGRVSEEGLLALCRRVGIPFEKTNEAGGYVLLLGDEAMCDIVFHNDQIAKVDLQTGLDGEQPDLRFGQMGSQILVRSLKPLAGQSNINVTLDRFAENLDKLLTLDKLGAPSNGGVSCYNAIAGVYTSLRRLFEHEKNMALALIDANASHRSHKAERQVMCSKSGRPRLNGGLCLGLSLEYWMDRRHLISQASDKGKDKMDIDGQDEYPEDDDLETNKMYSLTLECEATPSALFTPIRISNEWLSEAIEKPADANDANASIDNILLNAPSIDWLDPKPTYLEPPAATGAHDDLNLDSAPGRLPNIRFVARFNPPLVVPLAVYMQLYQSVGLEPRPEDFRPTTFVGLALRPNELDPGMLGTAGESTHEIRSTRDVVVVDSAGQQKDAHHKMSLYVPKMEYSRTLESLPFAHPKQIVEILPILRQYACTTSLLQGSFVDGPNTTTTTTTTTA
jgi:hypothetical protein